MAFEFATGTINIGTGAVNTTYAVTTKTGTWKAIILFWSGSASATDAGAEQDIKPGLGFAVSSSSRRAITTQSDHGNTTTATDEGHFNDCCVALLDIAGAVVAKADFVSFDANGFTVKVTDVFPAVLEVGYVLLGGADLTNAEIGNFTLATGTGDTDYTSLTTFQPDFALFIANSDTTSINTPVVTAQMSIGVATASAQAVLSCQSSDAQADADTFSYCLAGECIATNDAASPLLHCSLTSFLSTGFRINHIAKSGTPIVSFLALKGGSYAIGNFLTATDTTAFTEAHGMAVTPKGIFCGSANRAADTAGTATATWEWSVGASDGSANFCHYVRDKDASAAMDCFLSVSHDQCYQNASNATTQAIEGEGHVTSFDATNINLIMTDADPVASFVWYVAFGNTYVPSSRTALNTRSNPLGMEIGFEWRMVA